MKTRILLLLNLLFLVCGADLASAFYDPTVGRWLNRDPIADQGFIMRQPYRRHAELTPIAERKQGPNYYAFVWNNPIRHFDRNGLEVLCYYQADTGEWTCKSPLDHDSESAVDCWFHYVNPPHCPFWRMYFGVSCINYEAQGYSSWWDCVTANSVCYKH